MTEFSQADAAAIRGHHVGPENMPQTSRFLSDAEYRFVQNNIVIGCTDVMIVDTSTAEVLSGFRQQKPQEGYWFSCGGRMKRGIGYQENGAAKIEEELGVAVDPQRLEFLTAYSTAYDERAQEPRNEGSHTSNAVMVLFVSGEERAEMTVNLNKEHAKADWVPLEEVAKDDGTFPLVLRDAVNEVERALIRDFTMATLATDGVARRLTYHRESKGMPQESFEVPPGQVWFDINTTSRDYAEAPFRTLMSVKMPGETVNVPTMRPEGRLGYEARQGVMLAEGESQEVETYLLGFPVKSRIENKDGNGQVLEAYQLPQSLVDNANRVELDIADPYYPIVYRSDHFTLRFRTVMGIARELRKARDYTAERTPRSARHVIHHYSPDGQHNGFTTVDPYIRQLSASR